MQFWLREYASLGKFRLTFVNGITVLFIFRVTDIHKHIEQLKKRRIELLGKEVEIRPGAWVVYFRGPDGEVCEFREFPEGK